MDYAASQTLNRGASVSKYLIISVNGSDYAVGVHFIHKIVELTHVSFQPHAKPYILGVAKADGGIYTVVDLRILFGRKREKFQAPVVAVLLTYGALKTCIVVDRVVSVIDIDTGSAGDLLAEHPYISGIVQADDRLISILSVDRLIPSEDEL